MKRICVFNEVVSKGRIFVILSEAKDPYEVDLKCLKILHYVQDDSLGVLLRQPQLKYRNNIYR